MWSDKDIDNAFQRLNPPEPDPTPFPLDAWLRLETELDKSVVERAVRRRLWQFFAAEVAVVALVALGWLLWPRAGTRETASKPAPLAAGRPVRETARPASDRAAGTPAGRPGTAAEPAGRNGAAVAALAPGLRHGTQADATTETHSARLGNEQLAATPFTQLTRRRSMGNQYAAATSGAASQKPRTARAGRPIPSPATSTTYSSDASARQSAVGHESTEAAARHSAAGTSTAPTAVSGEAAVAAAASRTLRGRQGQSPLRQLAAGEAPIVPTPGAETRATRAAGQIAATASAEGGPELPGLLPTAAALAGPPATELPAPPAAPSVAPADLPAPVREPRFFVGLVGAPDVTTVKLAGVYAPMLNVGVTVEYRLGQRWRLSTGLLHSSKKYVALRDDYDWGTNYARVYQRSFEDVDGSCTVLDIPLNLRYDLLVYPQSRLFGSLGLSSFLMQREHYSYDYLENNVRKQWNGEFANQNQHLFSILNLSAGYERRLGGHWRVQAEPYLKLPLAGVGQGKVRLTSAGVFLGVKYGF